VDDASSRPADRVVRSEFAGDPDMAELLTLFLDELGPRVASMESAWREGDADQLHRIAHQIKGSAGGYGYPGISAAAFRIESGLAHAGGRSLDAIKAELNNLVDLCQAAIRGRS